MHSTRKKVSASLIWLPVAAVVIFSLIYFKRIIQPFMLALVVWYLISGVRNLLTSIHIKGKSIPHNLGNLVAVMLTITFLWAVVQIITYNIGLIVDQAGLYEENFDGLLDQLRNLTGIASIDKLIFGQFKGLELDLQGYATIILNLLTSMVGSGAVMLVYVIFILVEERRMWKKIQLIVSAREEGDALSFNLIRRMARSINTYFTMKFFASLVTGLLSYFVLLMLGIDFPVLWSFLIFLFNFVPYVGSLVATVLPSVFAIFQFGSFLPLFWTFLSVISIQFLVGQYLEPRIMGRTLNLSPLVVLISLAFWGSIWGVVGMLISVPVVVILVIILGHFDSTRNIAILLSEKGNVHYFGKADT